MCRGLIVFLCWPYKKENYCKQCWNCIRMWISSNVSLCIRIQKNIYTSWGWAAPSSVKLEVKVEVVVKVSSWSRGHSVLLRLGGWLGGWGSWEYSHLNSSWSCSWIEVGAELGNSADIVFVWWVGGGVQTQLWSSCGWVGVLIIIFFLSTLIINTQTRQPPQGSNYCV